MSVLHERKVLFAYLLEVLVDQIQEALVSTVHGESAAQLLVELELLHLVLEYSNFSAL